MLDGAGDFAEAASAAGEVPEPQNPESEMGRPRPWRFSVPAGYRYSDNGSMARAKYDIRAYVGLNGAGKSLAMVHDAIRELRKGRRVLSTVRIIDPETGKDHPLYTRLTDWSQLLEASSCLALFDEVQGIANSRASQGMPVQVQTFLHQLRRRDISLAWTSPSWSRADLLLREVTRSVTVCRGYFPEKRKVLDPLTGKKVRRSWGANRVFRWITYDAADFTDWTDSKEGNLKGKNNTWYLRAPIALVGRRQALAQAYYDTLDAVDRIGEVLDSGRCADCGGTRRPDPCSCSNYVNRPGAKTAGRKQKLELVTFDGAAHTHDLEHEVS